MQRRCFREAFRATLPVLAGYVFLGFAFGLLMRTAGCEIWQPVLMSLIIYSGALEYAAVPLLLSPLEPVSAFILSVMVSARHLFYGIPMLEDYRDTGARRPFLIFGLTDETFSLLSSGKTPEGTDRKGYCFAVTLLDYLYWNTGTLLGAVCGSLLPGNPEGLDFALTALFIVLFLEQTGSREGLISGLTGLLVSLAVLLVFGPGNMVLISMAGILLLLLLGRRTAEHE